jgi:hypothetical protein
MKTLQNSSPEHKNSRNWIVGPTDLVQSKT